MFCDNCAKLATFHTKKNCLRCQGQVLTNIAVLCEFCSDSERQCSVCLKKVITAAQRQANRGCNCGRK